MVTSSFAWEILRRFAPQDDMLKVPQNDKVKVPLNDILMAKFTVLCRDGTFRCCSVHNKSVYQVFFSE